MDDKTLTALQASIKHWEDNVAARGVKSVKLGIKECALCEYFGPFDEPSCVGCPVSERTGLTGCEGTPYDDVCEAEVEWSDHPRTNSYKEYFREIAQTELDFLKSLLPEKST